MGLGEIEKVFVDKTQGGLFFPFFTVREIAKTAGDCPSNVRKYLKSLISVNAVREHPFNNQTKAKRYQLNRDYFTKNYLRISIVEKETREILKC